MCRAALLLALLCPLTAAKCTADECADETSLVQVKQIVKKHGNERIPNEAADWDTPVHDLDSVTDSTPDGLDVGEVMDAFTKNSGEVRSKIEGEAASRIDFTNEEREERKKNYAKADAAVRADKKSVADAEAADKAAVAKTKATRKGVVDAAVSKVKAAKEAAEAHAIKAAQADKAAALGRKVGTIEGADAARHAWKDYSGEVKAEHEAAALKVAHEKIAAHEKAVEDGVKATTAAMAKADDAWVARAARSATVSKAKSAANAAKEELEIEGAEGLKNTMADVKADWAELHYNRETDASQADIDAAAAGSIGIDQAWTDSDAAGPGEEVASGLDFAAPDAGLGTTAFEEALAGESLMEIPNEAAGWSTPVHDMNAITDSTPDHLDAGQVMDSFQTNAEKVRNEIEAKAASRIDFMAEQRGLRRVDYKTADEKVKADKAAVDKAIQEDKDAVAKTKKERADVIAKDVERVKLAKEASIAHHIKAAQAEHAAVLGRKVGTIEGKDAAAHAWADYKAEVAAEHKQAALAVARNRIAAAEAAKRKAVNAKTKAMAEADDAWVARAERAATVTKARAAANAAKLEEKIEGAEGLKNKMTDVKADWAVLHYERATKADQARIDAAADASWPEGDWPVGP